MVVVLIAQIRTQARKQYLAWREKDFDSLRAEQMHVARREAKTELEGWKMENEAWMRQDAITRSHAVNLGKITEHLLPYMSVFPYNPKDVRFVGSPIDLIVFDGIDEGELREILFLEVKTGTSSLSTRQRQIRDALLSGRVRWIELRLDRASYTAHGHNLNLSRSPEERETEQTEITEFTEKPFLVSFPSLPLFPFVPFSSSAFFATCSIYARAWYSTISY